MCLALLALCLLGWRWVLSPDLAEQASLLQSLDPHSKDVAGGWFGTNALPVLEDLVRIQTLSPSLLPSSSEDPVNYRRLIFIGDVHGCKDECTCNSPVYSQQSNYDSGQTPQKNHL